MNQIVDEVKSQTVIPGIFTPLAGKPYQKPAVRSIQHLLRAQAARGADLPAILALDRAPLTYGRLLDQVERTVKALRAFGVQRNDRVAVVLPNGSEMGVSFLAIACGATCAPLNPGYRDSEFDFYLSDLNAKALVILAGMDSPARAVAAQRNIPVVELRPLTADLAGLFELGDEKNHTPSPPDFAMPEDIALVLHTSGTTSRPKIVPLKHANLCSSAHNIAITLDLTANDRCLNVMPLFHIHGLIGALLSSLTAGASVACSPGFDPAKFFGWLESFQPTWYSAVPTMHQAIVARATQQPVPPTPLRLIRSSSAALPPPVMADLEKIFGVPVVESYGMTEASHQMASNPLPPLPRKPGSVGLASGPDMGIMDEAGNLLPPGAIGEVVIRGANVTSGYENNPKANQSSFTNGWFRTGDQGRFDSDGYLFLTSRLKEIINRGGEKIAPKEVDEVLLQHPAVAQAVAFAVPHSTLGEDVAAAVVLKKGVSAAEDEIRQFAAARLADFKVPQQLLILDEIPKGPTGKLQRIGLADKLKEQLQKNFVAAGTTLEKQLAEIWSRMLKIQSIGVRDNFYVLGGDSLRASAMLLEVENQFKKSIPVDSFLRSPTIETIAGLLNDKDSGGIQPMSGPQPKPIRDSFFRGIKNRLFQILALYAPGFKTTRVWLHRMRGVAIGRNVSIGTGALIETAYPRLVSLGNNVSIGMRAIIIGHLRDLTAQARTGREHTVRIEDDVYVGPGVIILPNVIIGKGSVISAGSVVSRSVPPQTLVQGNPAVPIAHCGVSLGGGVSYEQFLRHLTPIEAKKAS
jgi:acyl-CoA synthetase (AMP-forming)/AMP-acid ligase II/acetyltransferase-like isoleucine patch superfamily enzyme/acyl carrier protein